MALAQEDSPVFDARDRGLAPPSVPVTEASSALSTCESEDSLSHRVACGAPGPRHRRCCGCGWNQLPVVSDGDPPAVKHQRVSA